MKNAVQMSVPNKTVSKEMMQEEWLEIQLAQRDASMFRPLYQRYFEQILRFIYRRTAKEQLAADICSQVFLKAMQKLPSYQFRGVPFSAWLYRIASNEIAQHFRKVQKNRVVCIDDFSFMDLFSEIQEKDSVDYRQALLYALDQLKANDLQLIELRFFEQRPFKEIADILQITESNAKVKTYRILKKLKNIILTTGRQSSD